MYLGQVKTDVLPKRIERSLAFGFPTKIYLLAIFKGRFYDKTGETGESCLYTFRVVTVKVP